MSGASKVFVSETLDLLRFESQEALPTLMPKTDLGSHLQTKAHAKSSHTGRNLRNSKNSSMLTFYSQVLMAALELGILGYQGTTSLWLTIHRVTGDRRTRLNVGFSTETLCYSR